MSKPKSVRVRLRKLEKKQEVLVEQQSTVDRIKAWFKYSETIFLARLGVFFGFITSAVGGMDLSPLWSLFSTGTDFTQKQLLFIGIAIIGTGLSLEWVRRRGSKL